VACLRSLGVSEPTLKQFTVTAQPASAFRFVVFAEKEQIAFERLQDADLDIFIDWLTTFGKMFVVDDEQVIVRTLAIILQKNGFSATAVCDPLQALIAAKVYTPDLLLSDVAMPQLSVFSCPTMAPQK